MFRRALAGVPGRSRHQVHFPRSTPSMRPARAKTRVRHPDDPPMGSGLPARRGSARYRPAAEPDGEAIVGMPERDVDVKLVHGPQPKAKSPVRDVAWSGDEACQVIGWAAACVVNGDHDAARGGPDAYGRGRAAVAVCVADCFGDADQQVVERGGGDAAGADPRERVPGFGGGAVDQFDRGRAVFERIGYVRAAVEYQDVLVFNGLPYEPDPLEDCAPTIELEPTRRR